MVADLKNKLLNAGLFEAEATQIIDRIENQIGKSAEEIWCTVVKEVLIKKGAQYYPFSVHLLLYQTIYPNWQTTLLNHDHQQVYYAGMPELSSGVVLRRHGDRAKRYKNGYYRLLGRVDDTMNLSGIKMSAVEIENVLHTHPSVSEIAAVSVSDLKEGPEKLVVFLVLKSSQTLMGRRSGEEENENKIENFKETEDPKKSESLLSLKTELQNLIKKRLNPLFKIQDLEIVKRLPRTASNKAIRRALRDEYHRRKSLSTKD